MKNTRSRSPKAGQTQVVQEYGPFPGITAIHGVTYDGKHIWFAHGEGLAAVDPQSGALARELKVTAEAGTAFDGEHIWQLADDRIQKIDPHSGRVLSTIPAPAQGRDSGLTWAEGTLWVGEYQQRAIHQVDPETGAILRTIKSDRFVTGVTWLDDELWHATWESGESELRHIDRDSGAVLERLQMPAGTGISGLESDGRDRFFCGGGDSGKIRVVSRPAHA